MVRKITAVLAILSAVTFLTAAVLNAGFVREVREGLSASQAPSQDSKPLRFHLGLIIPDLSDSFFSDLVQGIQGASGNQEAAVQVFRYSGTFDDARAYFDICLYSGFDGIILYLPRGEGAAVFHERALAAGVILVIVGVDRPKDAPGSYIGSSSLQQGFEAGKLVGAALGPKARVGVILTSSRFESVTEDPYYKGVASALAVYGVPYLLTAARPGGGIFSGEEVAASLLEKYPALNAFVCSTALETEGAAQVVVDFNRVGQIFIVGSDESEVIRRYLTKGVLGASVVRDSKKIGQEALMEFRRRKDGNSPSPPREIGFRVTMGKDLQ